MTSALGLFVAIVSFPWRRLQESLPAKLQKFAEQMNGQERPDGRSIEASIPLPLAAVASGVEERVIDWQLVPDPPPVTPRARDAEADAWLAAAQRFEDLLCRVDDDDTESLRFLLDERSRAEVTGCLLKLEGRLSGTHNGDLIAGIRMELDRLRTLDLFAVMSRIEDALEQLRENVSVFRCKLKSEVIGWIDKARSELTRVEMNMVGRDAKRAIGASHGGGCGNQECGSTLDEDEEARIRWGSDGGLNCD
jgi:hypothetical protein